MFSHGRSLSDLCTDFADATVRSDEEASATAFQASVGALEEAAGDELSEGLAQFIPALKHVSLGNGVMLAQLTAGLIEYGGDPLTVLDVLVERVADGLEQAARFAVLAEKLGGELAAPTDQAEMFALRDRVVQATPAAGLSVAEAGVVTEAWFSVNSWIPSLLLPLQQKRARQALPQRSRLTDAVSAMTEDVDAAPWLLGLLLVLDDEQIIVLHRESRQAYSVTISGIGDNFQLHPSVSAARTAADRPWVASDLASLHPAAVAQTLTA